MSELPEAYRNAVSFAFGDTPKLADDLLALVLSGKDKRKPRRLDGEVE